MPDTLKNIQLNFSLFALLIYKLELIYKNIILIEVSGASSAVKSCPLILNPHNYVPHNKFNHKLEKNNTFCFY